MTTVDIAGARKTHGAREVLSGVDLAAPDGAITALLGPSGCGKTTLLRLIAGFDRLDAGEIALGGRVVSGPTAHLPPEKRRIGYVPQEGALFPHLSVAGNVGFGLTRAERRGPRIGDTLALVGVSELTARYPHELSGGQQQRVALARALAPRPGVVLLDEPFNGLDLDLRRAVSAEVMAALRKTGASAILVSHDPEEAFASADVVAVMDKGRIAQAGAPETVYAAPVSAAVARITGPAIFLDAAARDGRADTALGVLPIRPDSRCPEGAARLCLRPEQIVTVAGGGGRAGTVTARSFRGDHCVLTVAFGDLALPVRAPASMAIGPDEPVHVAVLGPCVAFPAEL
jgi:iron(III) transport system ATP-binding protein